MQRLVRAFPLLPGKEDQLRSVYSALQNEKAEQARSFYKGMGVAHESWYVQHTSAGSQVIVVTIVDNLGSRTPLFAAANDTFVLWLKSQVLEMTGVDLNLTPLGPPSEQVYSYPL